MTKDSIWSACQVLGKILPSAAREIKFHWYICWETWSWKPSYVKSSNNICNFWPIGFPWQKKNDESLLKTDLYEKKLLFWDICRTNKAGNVGGKKCLKIERIDRNNFVLFSGNQSSSSDKKAKFFISDSLLEVENNWLKSWQGRQASCYGDVWIWKKRYNTIESVFCIYELRGHQRWGQTRLVLL